MKASVPKAGKSSHRVLPQKMRRREARIIDAAQGLFAEHGYADTSIEMIAVQADVAIGTVYNYFQNKSELLMRAMTSGRPESLTASAALLEDPSDDPAEAFSRLLISQLRGAARHDKKLWRVIHATAAMEPETFGHEYFLGKVQFSEHITHLLMVLQARGQLRSNFDIATAAKAAKFIASEVFRRYVSGEIETLDEAATELDAMARLIVSAGAPMS